MCQARSTYASIDHRNHSRRDARVQRLAQHRLFDLTLFESETLLPRSLLLLLPLVFLGLSGQVIAHGLLLAGPLRRWGWHGTRHLSQLGRPTWIREGHRRKTAMRCRHSVFRLHAGPQRVYRRVDSWLRRQSRLRQRYSWREVMSDPAAKVRLGRL
jgi:hypothetical protein